MMTVDTKKRKAIAERVRLDTGLVMHPKYVGRGKTSQGWEHYCWRVSIMSLADDMSRGITIPFKTGLGHTDRKGMPVPPCVRDVLGSLRMDIMSLESMTYDAWVEDYCVLMSAEQIVKVYRDLVKVVTAWKKTFPDIDLTQYALLDDY